jgi:biotin operon repressor
MKEKDLKDFSDSFKNLMRTVSSLERNLRETNERIDALSDILTGSGMAERSHSFRAKTERLHEHTEQPLTDENLNRIRGRHRELLALLINNGFHTYDQIAQKLDISRSRARAYVAELKNSYGLPLRQVRDAEGYKIGIDMRFVERVLAFR